MMLFYILHPSYRIITSFNVSYLLFNKLACEGPVKPNSSISGGGNYSSGLKGFSSCFRFQIHVQFKLLQITRFATPFNRFDWNNLQWQMSASTLKLLSLA